MTAANAASQPQQSRRFLLLYALAVAGGAVAYVPFLTILLPVQVAAFDSGSAVKLLGLLAFAGAIAASLANIGFGWLSDLSGVRRPWIAAGAVLSGVLLSAMRLVEDTTTLIALIIAWQFALNMMLAPLAAWAGDSVPDAQKGMLGGLLAIAPAMGALSGALVTIPGFAVTEVRPMVVAGLVAAMVLPVLIFGNPRPMPALMDKSAPRAATTRPRGTAARMWLARLLVQIAEAALFAYLLIWFRSVDAEFGDNDTAILFAIVLALAVPLALLAGRWSDRAERPVLPLTIGSGIGAFGLVVMGLAPSLTIAIAGYVVFGLATSVFLALHSSQTLRVLPSPRTRGRDLGVFNLTNTVPSLIMPWLTLALVPVFGFDALFMVLAALSVVACILLMTLQRRI
ncbi:MFS transporter [Qipengyuania marisflavi]|uniref:MFS transporter n=1 Tax=Qipengyuania marisflavi TaxID=2486356 RepID=A0A5S3PRM4_9SPHN|nr:MFS transporter [Qipengyuania marisflavi]TMM46250.1 MFS transporter [Qipengyuania marisflavi]